MRILAIETSCDDTAVAVVDNGRKIISSAVASQIEEHLPFGGVVPELASRAHSENILWLTKQALAEACCQLSDIDAVAVTMGPGLVGALLVGCSFAKGLAMSLDLPLIPVHHIAGHIAANYLAYPDLEPPFLCLVVSGGHSHVVEVKNYTDFSVFSRTRDDAAGECFDKVARAMGFPYPGGIHIDKLAPSGNPQAFPLPTPKVEGSPFDYSFSGLKTAVINLIHKYDQKGEELNKADLAASFQGHISRILIGRFMEAAQTLGYKKLALAGGVSANSGIRGLFEGECRRLGFIPHVPPLGLCGDNAAMIGCQGYYCFRAGITADESLNSQPSISL